MSRDRAEAVARTLRAVSDPARLRLLCLIASSFEGEASVTDLTERIELSQPTVSHHVKILTEAGYLTRRRRGAFTYYRLAPESPSGVLEVASFWWAPRLYS